MAKARRKRSSYSDAKRNEIMSVAQKEGLTAAEVQKRFGVTPVTYYSWRKKFGATRRRGGAARARGRGRTAGAAGPIRGLQDMVAGIVRAELQTLRTDVRAEVEQYLGTIFGGGGRTGGRGRGRGRRRRGRPRRAA